MLQVYGVIVTLTVYIYSALAYFFFPSSEHFNTVFDSFITMFQLLVGEGWHEVSGPAAWSTHFRRRFVPTGDVQRG